MRLISGLLLSLTILIALPNCSATNDITSVGGPTRYLIIRPFGDSITYGIGFSSLCYQWPLANTGGGYRGWMTALALTPPGINFYFSTVGNKFMGSNVQQANTNSAFHDGYPGWRTDQLQGIAEIKLPVEPTQTLIHAGTNDILQKVSPQTAWDNLKGVLQNLRKNNPNTKLFVAAIIRLADTTANQSFNQAIDEFNRLIKANVTEKNFPNSAVVDMSGANFLNNSDYISDGIHPGCTGYVKMACAWIGGMGGMVPLQCTNPQALCALAKNPPACNTTKPNQLKDFMKRVPTHKR